jgi:hypothetical protein
MNGLDKALELIAESGLTTEEVLDKLEAAEKAIELYKDEIKEVLRLQRELYK